MKKEERKWNLQNVLPWKNFMKLPLWMRTGILNFAVLLLLIVGFFVIGNYLYSPQKTARDYYEAMLEQDWNRVYDCCIFPDGEFLSRKNFVNAMSYKNSKSQENREIKNYRMRLKKTDKENQIRTYEVSYSLQGKSEVQKHTVKLARKERYMGFFHQWYVIPEDMYVENVEVVIPEDAVLFLDGILIGESMEEKQPETKQDVSGTETNGRKAYRIPELFRGFHTVQLSENKREGNQEYRDIIEVRDAKPLEILPELKLNDTSGKKIADEMEHLIHDFCEAAMKQQSYGKVQEYFVNDEAVQEKAKHAFEEFRSHAANEKKSGITNLAITNIATNVSNSNGNMTANVEISYTEERVEKKLFFFYRTVTDSGTRNLELKLKNLDGEWKIETWS